MPPCSASPMAISVSETVSMGALTMGRLIVMRRVTRVSSETWLAWKSMNPGMRM